MFVFSTYFESSQLTNIPVKLLTLSSFPSIRSGVVNQVRNIEHCWQKHDECNHMVPHETRYGFTNELTYQVWHCNCALEFYLCMHLIDSPLSTRIGELYFTANGKCYRGNYPISKCLVYDENKLAQHSKRCVQYLLDVNAPFKMQWFDLPFYSGEPPRAPMFTTRTYPDSFEHWDRCNAKIFCENFDIHFLNFYSISSINFTNYTRSIRC